MNKFIHSMRLCSISTVAKFLLCMFLLSSCGGQSSSTVDSIQSGNTPSGIQPGSTVGNAPSGFLAAPVIMKVFFFVPERAYISWKGVLGYRYHLYKNGSLLYTTPGDHSFGGTVGSDIDLIAGEQVCYQVSASTREGVRSALSDPVCVVVGSDNQNYERQVADLGVIEISDRQTLAFSWETSTDDENLGYRIYRNERPLATVTQQFYSDTNLLSGTEYCYQVTVIDKQNIESPPGEKRCERPRIVWQEQLFVPSQSLTSVVVFGGQLVAASADYFFSSFDGAHWDVDTDITSPPHSIEDSVVFGDKIYGVGNSGRVYYSSDGANWQGSNREMHGVRTYSIAASDSMLVAVGEEGSIHTFTDGGEWTRRSVSDLTSDLYEVKWLNDQFVVAGSGGAVLFSGDGVDWEVHRVSPESEDPLTPKLESVTWTGESYVTAGGRKSYISSDGVAWDVSTTSGMTFSGLVWSDELTMLVAVGSPGKIATSRDGSEWDLQDPNVGGLSDVIWDGEQFIAVGDYGLILTSSDGIQWTTRSKSLTLNSVVAIDNTFYAVGGRDHILKSADGLNWEYVQTGLEDGYFHDIAGDGDRYVVAGQNYIYVADSNFSWVQQHWLGATSSALSVIWDGERFVAVRSGGVVKTSTDGVEFSSVIPRSEPNVSNTLLRDIVHRAGLYVVVGNSGKILTSTDLINFTEQASPTTANLLSVVSNGERFVAVGEDQTIVTSANGTDWNIVPHITYRERVGYFREVIWAEDRFIAVGLTFALSSPNGVDWQPLADRESPVGYTESVAFNDDRYVVIGSNSRIATFERR